MRGLPTSHQHPTYAPCESGGICVKRGLRPEPVRERCWLQRLTHPLPALNSVSADPAAHLVPSSWPACSKRTSRIRDDLGMHTTKTQPTSASVFDVHYQRPSLLLSSPDQRLLLFLLLLLILFSSLITQSSLTMTPMLMWRWRGCFNELPSRSDGLRGGRRGGK